MQTVANWWGFLRGLGQKAGPYLMVEMLLPGGTLLALLLFLYRRRKPGMRALARAFERSILVPAQMQAAVREPKAGAIECCREGTA